MAKMGLEWQAGVPPGLAAEKGRASLVLPERLQDLLWVELAFRQQVPLLA